MGIVEPDISPEQFIPEHVFLYIIHGAMQGYDGHKSRMFKAGEGYLFRKNHLVRYKKEKAYGTFDKVILTIEEPFLRAFQEKHKAAPVTFDSTESFFEVEPNDLLLHFIQSLQPYYQHGKMDAPFGDLKREELLLILLKNHPELAGIFFDYGKPEKINLSAFMNRNYTFNVSIERFAYLTGRSLSAFKRDFKAIFKETPNHWLVQRRLQEAYFLIEKKNGKPSEIYLDLGFESLSHFSYAFKKRFGVTATELKGR